MTAENSKKSYMKPLNFKEALESVRANRSQINLVRFAEEIGLSEGNFMNSIDGVLHKDKTPFVVPRGLRNKFIEVESKLNNTFEKYEI